MSRKSNFSAETKRKAIKAFRQDKKTILQLSNEIGCAPSAIRWWVRQEEKTGKTALENKPKNRSYTKEAKERAVHEYLDGNGSLTDVSIDHGISDPTLLRNWIKKYNSHIELKDYDPKGAVYMTKTKKTTLEEKREIVRYCLEHGGQYKLAAEHYAVAYSQVYMWVRKYQVEGENGLLDRRGRRKAESELTELEKAERAVKRLQQQNTELKMEIELRKKVKEIERRLYSEKYGKKRNT